MELDQEEKDIEEEMNVLGEKILKKQLIGETTRNLHERIWTLKNRVDEIRRIRKDTKVSR
tara:strand:+ start:399 stop:578 length:180 start_codon:yes stop_codon:yes gene_type:complete